MFDLLYYLSTECSEFIGAKSGRSFGNDYSALLLGRVKMLICKDSFCKLQKDAYLLLDGWEVIDATIPIMA